MIPQNTLSSKAISSDFYTPDSMPRKLLVDYELGGIGIKDPSRGLQVQVWTVRYERSDVVVYAPNNSGVILFHRPDIVELSLAWDQNMRPFIAYKLLNGETWYWWYDTVSQGQIFTQLAGDIQDPRCALDDKRGLETGSSDVILTYIKNQGLYFRAQRERYGVEHLLKSPIQGRLKRVGMNTVGRFQWLLSKEVVTTVDIPELKISGDLDDSLAKGQPIVYTYQVNGGKPPYVFSVSYGTLPDGLNLGNAGTVAGTTANLGYFVWRIQVRDTIGNTASIVDASTVENPNPLKLLGGAAGGRVGIYYEYTYNARGGIPPYTFSFVGGTLPPGLSFSYGTISGTPTTVGAYNFTIRVGDFAGTEVDVVVNLNIYRNPQTLILRDQYGNIPDPPDGVSNMPYAHYTNDPTAEYVYMGLSGEPPYSYSVSGNLPSGLMLTERDSIYTPYTVGVLSGTPTDIGSFTFTVTVADSTNATASEQATIIISEPDFTIVPTVPAQGYYAVPYEASYDVTYEGGQTIFPLNIEIVSGSIPTGCVLVNHSQSRQIMGNPIEMGVFNWTLKFSDTFGNSKQISSTAKIVEKFIFYLPKLDGVVGIPFEAAPHIEGGKAPFLWTIDNPTNLPPGLLFDIQTGVVSGTPTQSGLYTWTVYVVSSDGQTANDTNNCYISTT